RHLFALTCFLTDATTTEIYTLSLHDALPIFKAEVIPGPVQKDEYLVLYSQDGHQVDKQPGNPRQETLEFNKRQIDYCQFSPDCRDRKSTRLNSSHVKISYAVFCLKKKTNKTT